MLSPKSSLPKSWRLAPNWTAMRVSSTWPSLLNRPVCFAWLLPLSLRDDSEFRVVVCRSGCAPWWWGPRSRSPGPSSPGRMLCTPGSDHACSGSFSHARLRVGIDPWVLDTLGAGSGSSLPELSSQVLGPWRMSPFEFGAPRSRPSPRRSLSAPGLGASSLAPSAARCIGWRPSATGSWAWPPCAAMDSKDWSLKSAEGCGSSRWSWGFEPNCPSGTTKRCWAMVWACSKTGFLEVRSNLWMILSWVEGDKLDGSTFFFMPSSHVTATPKIGGDGSGALKSECFMKKHVHPVHKVLCWFLSSEGHRQSSKTGEVPATHVTRCDIQSEVSGLSWASSGWKREHLGLQWCRMTMPFLRSYSQ